MIDRKGILLRLTPGTLERVDQARGALNRTQWLTNAINHRLEEVEGGDSLHEIEQRRSAQEEEGEPYPLNEQLFAKTAEDEAFDELAARVSHGRESADRPEADRTSFDTAGDGEGSDDPSQTSPPAQGETSQPVDRGEDEPEGRGYDEGPDPSSPAHTTLEDEIG